MIKLLIADDHEIMRDCLKALLRDQQDIKIIAEAINGKDAIEKLKPKPEITRFKGLGEISPDEFKNFIGETIRLDPIMMDKNTSIEQLLSFYMGKNTPDRQEFIIKNLKVELDAIEEEV